MTLISVVIPAHNAAATLPATLQALQAQTWTRWEAFVLDDASRDDTRAVACGFAARDRRITVLESPRRGPSATRNHAALALARGDVISFCDADDLWTPGKLEDVAGAIRAGEGDAVYGRTGFFHDDPTRILSRSTVPRGPLTVPMLLGENPVCTLSNLSVKRDVLAGIGGFREHLSHNEDLDLLVRLAGAGHRITGLDRDHVLYRLSPNGLSADLAAMRASRIEVLRMALDLGHRADRRSEARYLRYLARRALRIDAPAAARRLVAEGLRTDAQGFLHPLRRGGLVALGALVSGLLPRPLRRHLFAR